MIRILPKIWKLETVKNMSNSSRLIFPVLLISQASNNWFTVCLSGGKVAAEPANLASLTCTSSNPAYKSDLPEHVENGGWLVLLSFSLLGWRMHWSRTYIICSIWITDTVRPVHQLGKVIGVCDEIWQPSGFFLNLFLWPHFRCWCHLFVDVWKVKVAEEDVIIWCQQKLLHRFAATIADQGGWLPQFIVCCVIDCDLYFSVCFVFGMLCCFATNLEKFSLVFPKNTNHPYPYGDSGSPYTKRENIRTHEWTHHNEAEIFRGTFLFSLFSCTSRRG